MEYVLLPYFLFMPRLEPLGWGAFATTLQISHIITRVTHSSFCHVHLWVVWLLLCLLRCSWAGQWALVINSLFSGWELPHLSLPSMWCSPHQSWCLLLYLIQCGNVFLIPGSPELDPVLQVWPHWEGIDVKDHCPGCSEAYFSKMNDPLTKFSHIIPTDPAVQIILVLALLPSTHYCFSIP